MPEYIIAYRGGKKPENPADGANEMARWKTWVEDMGDDAINPGTPLGKSVIISSQGVSDEPVNDAMSGYTIVRADDMDAALKIASACPFLDMEEATLEVAQIMKMG